MNTHAGDRCNLSRIVREDRPGGGIAADGRPSDGIPAEESVVGGITEEGI